MATKTLWLGFAAGALLLVLLWLALPSQSTNDMVDWVIRTQRAYLSEMRTAVRAIRAGDLTAVSALLGGAFVYGVLHAIGPGHGKAVIASYVVADGATLRRGLLVTALSSLAQGASAVLLVGSLALIFGLGRAQVEYGAWIIEVLATSLLVALGLLQAYRASMGADDHHCDHGHGDHAIRPQDHGHHHHAALAPSRNEHPHRHARQGEHRHLEPAGAQRSMLAVALTIGLRPCSGAIVLLLFAMVQGVLLAGIAGVFAMAAGTGLTVAVLAIGAVYGRRLAGTIAEATDRAAGLQRAIAVAGWLAVAGFGALLLAAAWQGPGGLL